MNPAEMQRLRLALSDRRRALEDKPPRPPDGRCIYCGWMVTKRPGSVTCAAHTYLLKLDPYYTEA